MDGGGVDDYVKVGEFGFKIRVSKMTLIIFLYLKNLIKCN